MTLFARTHLPRLDGATQWVNTEPLAAQALRGRVVLVDFWTLTCINWLRTEPYVRAWSQAYRDDGLVVLGVHTPEFSFERDVDLMRQAIADRGIDYPVVGTGVEAAADWDHLGSPETYLGYERRELFASPDGLALDERREYRLRAHLPLNEWALAGEWTIGAEKVVPNSAGARLVFRFSARAAHLVMTPGARSSIPFRLLLDGERPGSSHGVDVDEDGNGELRYGRMYQLVRQDGPVRERTLEIFLAEPGAEGYVFTFGLIAASAKRARASSRARTASFCCSQPRPSLSLPGSSAL